MGFSRLTIPETGYRRMYVLDGPRHRVRFRLLDMRNVGRDRGTLHAIACRAGGFAATRRLTERRAALGRWHAVEVGRRDLTRRMLVDLELLARQGIVEVELDGHPVGLRKARR